MPGGPRSPRSGGTRSARSSPRRSAPSRRAGWPTASARGVTAPPSPARAGGRELNDVRRRARGGAPEEPLRARRVEAAQHDEHGEADGKDQVEPVEQREAEQYPAQQGVAARASRVGDPPALQRDREAEEAERDSSDPAEGGEPDRRDGE